MLSLDRAPARRLALIIAALVALLAAGAAPASAADRTVTGGSLTWGIKASFRSYVSGPIADGSISTTGGASRTGGGEFVFGSGSGTVSDSGAATIQYSGAARFTGHDGVLHFSLANPRLVLQPGGSGTLTMTKVDAKGGSSTVALASVSGARLTVSGTRASFSGASATLTSAGTSLFSYQGDPFYDTGAALDPVSASITLTAPPAAAPTRSSTAAPRPAAPAPSTSQAPRARPTAAPRASGSSSSSAAATGSPTAASTSSSRSASPSTSGAATSCEVIGRNLTWGLKESFRSYISGSIANGDWQTSGGADYKTPAFRWAKGTSSDAARGGKRVSVTFPGKVRFTGHDGKLDTRVTNPKLVLTGAETAVLHLSTSGVSMKDAMGGDAAKPVVHRDVPFATVDLSTARVSTSGSTTTMTVREAPTTLTADGQEAMANYEAGTPFDPISVTVSGPTSCLAKAMPTAVASPSSPESARDTAQDADVGSEVAASAQDGTPWWPFAVGALVLVAAAAALLALRRRGDRSAAEGAA